MGLNSAFRNRRADARRSPRRGFTLVELLVAMLIILILAGLTLAAVNIGASGDRIPGGARQTQSMLLGARDRAIYAGEPRGMRLIKDPDNPNAVASFVFIGAPQSYGENRGTVTVEEFPPLSGTWVVTEENPRLSQWARLKQRGLLVPGARITFGDQNRWYTIADDPDPANPPDAIFDLGDGTRRHRAVLTRAYEGQPPGQASYTGLSYRVELAPSVLPNEEPRLLPRGIVIDLHSSYVYEKIPASWYAVTNDGGDGSIGPVARRNDTVVFSDTLDVMFNERGTIHGPLASQGVLHLVVADAADVLNGFRVWHGNSGTLDVNGDGAPDEREAPESIISVFTNAGTVAVSQPDDSDGTDPSATVDGLRDDPWYLAETGGEG